MGDKSPSRVGGKRPGAPGPGLLAVSRITGKIRVEALRG